jgi:hypothetical protein
MKILENAGTGKCRYQKMHVLENVDTGKCRYWKMQVLENAGTVTDPDILKLWSNDLLIAWTVLWEMWMKLLL